jgi:hypothetical protein
MNRILELLEVSRWGDGIYPEYSKGSMLEALANMNEEEFNRLTRDLKVAAKIYDLHHPVEEKMESRRERQATLKNVKRKTTNKSGGANADSIYEGGPGQCDQGGAG